MPGRTRGLVPAAWPEIGLALLALAVFAVRWPHGGLWSDEVQAITIALHPGQVWTFLAAHESHPPGFYLLLAGWTAVWGTTEAALFALTAVIGSALAVSTYIVARRLYDREVALTALFLLVPSLAFADSSFLVRPYGLMALVLLWLIWSTARAMERDTWRDWLLAGVIGGAGLWLHNSMWILGGAVALTVAIRRPGALRKGWLAAVAALVVVGPWLPAVLQQARQAGYGGSVGPWEVDVFPAILAFYTAVAGEPGAPIATWFLPATLAAIALAAGGVRGMARAVRAGQMVVAGLPPLVLAVVVAARPWSILVTSRGFLVLAPVLFIFLADWARRSPRLLGAALVGTLLLSNVVTAVERTRARTNGRELAMALAAERAPGEAVVAVPDIVGLTMEWYGVHLTRTVPPKAAGAPAQYDDRSGRLLSPDDGIIGTAPVWIVFRRDWLQEAPPPRELSHVPHQFYRLELWHLLRLRREARSAWGAPCVLHPAAGYFRDLVAEGYGVARCSGAYALPPTFGG